MHPDTPRPFTAKSIVTSIIQNRERLAPGLKKFQDTIVERSQLMQEQMLADKQLERRVKGSPDSAKAQRTWLFVRELLGSLLRDSRSALTRNNAMDLFHAVVPVAYCDFVLLDAQWEHRVTIIGQRLVEHNVGIKPADVFSKKRGGVERFLEGLERR